MIVGINMITTQVFESIVQFEKHLTINNETMGVFQRIIFLQYANIALVVLLININLIDGKLLGFIPLLNGEYHDISTQWYANIGQALCLTLFINIFSPHVSKIAKPIVKILKRWKDRGFRFSFVKNSEEDEVQTKLELQSDLNDLYTGDQIASHFVYAQNYTYLWCVMTYSCGMPILYPLAFLFYMVLYIVYKFLLIKFYQKTTKFNEELPLFTVNYIRLAIVWHCIGSLFMISNTDLLMSIEEMTLPTYYFDNGSVADIMGHRFFMKPHVIIYMLGVCFIFGVYMLQNTILKWIYLLFKCVCSSLKSSRVEADAIIERDQAHSNDFFKDITIKFLMDQFDKTKNDIKNCPEFDDKNYH